MSICASNQDRQSPYTMVTSDIKRAYFSARAARPISIEIPVEDREEGDEDKVGKLNLSIYGTRGAAQNWQAEFIEYLVSSNFSKGQSSPCNFDHPLHSLHLIVHGDDFTTIGPFKGLRWFEQLLNKRYECKHKLLGPEGERSVGVFNRVPSWQDDGSHCEADQRHAELIVEQLELDEAKAVFTPGAREEQVKASEE